MQMLENVKKIWDAVTTALVVLVVIFAVFLMGSRLVGLQVFNVISGSMEPTYSVGDLLYVKTVDPDSVKVGDPITFVLNEITGRGENIGRIERISCGAHLKIQSVKTSRTTDIYDSIQFTLQLLRRQAGF